MAGERNRKTPDASEPSGGMMQAKEDWKAGRFAPVPDETEFIPLPESGPAVVRYP